MTSPKTRALKNGGRHVVQHHQPDQCTRKEHAEMNRIRRALHAEGGFTLIELLIVIVILGILAAIVVFAVAGINNKGTAAACQSEKTTLTAAEEANYAKSSSGTVTGTYTDTAGLVTSGLVASGTTGHYYTASITGGGTGYTINPIAGSGCP